MSGAAAEAALVESHVKYAHGNHYILPVLFKGCISVVCDDYPEQAAPNLSAILSVPDCIHLTSGKEC